MSSLNDQLKFFREWDAKIFRLSCIKYVLQWDQDTCLPFNGVEERAQQLALIQGQIHESQTSPVLMSLVEELSENDSLSQENKALLRYHQRAIIKASRLPKIFVERQARLVSLSQRAWVQSRQKKNFAIFSPFLKDLVKMAQESVEFLGYQEHPYDALLDDYEPFTTSREIRRIFDVFEQNVCDLLKRISQQPPRRTDFLNRDFSRSVQEKVGRKIITDLGFDWNSGRLDVSNHPFCATLGPYDVRITTRYEGFPSALYGMIHETGHALYEQGFAPSLRGTSLAQGASMGIHESQSRFLEQILARSRDFVCHYFPFLKENFPQALADVEAEEFYQAINHVSPSLIRVEADEITYNLHIILRFRLELALIEGSLEVKDVPQVWNDESEKLLGLRPTDDAQGCLQDVHWSMGLFGYFPTYTLGNMYAAQFLQSLTKALPEWRERVGQGQFSVLLSWLREQIHHHGNVYLPRELCSLVTGQNLTTWPYLDYLNEKYGNIYKI